MDNEAEENKYKLDDKTQQKGKKEIEMICESLQNIDKMTARLKELFDARMTGARIFVQKLEKVINKEEKKLTLTDVTSAILTTPSDDSDLRQIVIWYINKFDETQDMGVYNEMITWFCKNLDDYTKKFEKQFLSLYVIANKIASNLSRILEKAVDELMNNP